MNDEKELSSVHEETLPIHKPCQDITNDAREFDTSKDSFCKGDNLDNAAGVVENGGSELHVPCVSYDEQKYHGKGDTDEVIDEADKVSEPDDFVDALEGIQVCEDANDFPFGTCSDHKEQEASTENNFFTHPAFQSQSDKTDREPSSKDLETDADDKFDVNFEVPEPTNAETIDNEKLLAMEAELSEEERLRRKTEARRLKEEGNAKYTASEFSAAISLYTDALVSCLLSDKHDRAVLYANRAAAEMKMENHEVAIEDCTKALEYNSDYMKALLRRAELYEKTDKLDEALADYQKALERDPSLHQARAACMRLPDQITERNEKMKTEMFGKLKDLGNMILRPFGLSTDNFKVQQDPNSGGYSINFQQNA